jgi:acyl dehydratase
VSTRRLHLDADDLRAYSRRGNFHSDPETARELGYGGLVAQGMQVAGPAYGLLLDAWGEEFLAHGELDLRFVGMVTDGQAVEATVADELEGASESELRVENLTTGATAVVGTARRRAR